MTKAKRGLIICAVIIGLIFAACAGYVSIYYHADEEAIAAFGMASDIVIRESDGMICFEAEDARAGLVFYPGGKVEYTAYAPLMRACAQRGITCVLLEMPFNLAVLDIDAAEGVCEIYPEIEEWYIAGHSLGGSMAAAYAEQQPGRFSGVVLLGAYSTADLSGSGMRVLSIYGSEDGVMNTEKYAEYMGNLPEGFEEYIIEGGCHAYFGMYGAQKGDGVPAISNVEQINIAADVIAGFIGE